MSYEEMNSVFYSEFHRIPDKARYRHFVTWSEEEDNMLREQVKIHGTERWSVIASKLRNKTGRQCRRRWNTYVSIPYKKGGWSPEEDMILFEAHQKFGNRWTEIAKVVQGRTDNAVKNRFNALHRKLEKKKSSKENDEKINVSVNKRVALKDESSVKTSDSTIFCKKMRIQFVNPSEGITLQRDEHAVRARNKSGTMPGDAAIKSGIRGEEPHSMLQSRAPLSVLPHENLTNLGQSGFLVHSSPYRALSTIKRPTTQVSKLHSVFLEKDNPRLSALTQQAELLSSLAQRRNAETSNQETENNWKAVDGILIEGKESLLNTEDQMKDQSPHPNLEADASTPFMTSKDKCQNATYLASKRLHLPSLLELCESYEKISQEGSEFSYGSKFHMDVDDMPKCNLIPTESYDFVCEDKSFQTSSTSTKEKEQAPSSSEDGCTYSAAVQHACSFKTMEEKDERLDHISPEYCSPVRVTPYIRCFVDEIPSPHFSDSERQFILNVLNLDSGTPSLDYRSPNQRCAPLCRISLSNRL